MGQFSMTISASAGSVLSDNQQPNAQIPLLLTQKFSEQNLGLLLNTLLCWALYPGSVGLVGHLLSFDIVGVIPDDVSSNALVEVPLHRPKNVVDQVYHCLVGREVCSVLAMRLVRDTPARTECCSTCR
jgi:hypothetical protein